MYLKQNPFLFRLRKLIRDKSKEYSEKIKEKTFLNEIIEQWMFGNIYFKDEDDNKFNDDLFKNPKKNRILQKGKEELQLI